MDAGKMNIVCYTCEECGVISAVRKVALTGFLFLQHSACYVISTAQYVCLFVDQNNNNSYIHSADKKYCSF
jgi:hypothetical protein